MHRHFTYYEFFAGGGMARAGLGEDWNCIFANDFDGKKALTYQDNWGTGGELFVGDIRQVKLSDLATSVDLAWASFPCQDLSLAGGGAGLKGNRSGTFYPFWNLINKLNTLNRGPRIVVLENVCGTLTSHKGSDFSSICNHFAKSGYRYGGLIINASLFVPQSRPRLFIVGIREDMKLPAHLLSPGAITTFHSRGLENAFQKITPTSKQNWLWWNLPSPPHRTNTFADLIEHKPTSVNWHTTDQTNKILSSMSALNLAKVDAAKQAKRPMVGTVYKRTRQENGRKIVRAEVRFDDIAGCLRTPNGGSSRQTILLIDGMKVRSRLISARETARLMGLNDTYRLPKKYNEAYHLTGDGVVVPVVRFLKEHLFEPVLNHNLNCTNNQNLTSDNWIVQNV